MLGTSGRLCHLPIAIQWHLLATLFRERIHYRKSPNWRYQLGAILSNQSETTIFLGVYENLFHVKLLQEWYKKVARKLQESCERVDRNFEKVDRKLQACLLGTCHFLTPLFPVKNSESQIKTHCSDNVQFFAFNVQFFAFPVRFFSVFVGFFLFG